MATPSHLDISARQLRAIVAIAANRSFIAAAAALKVSQPALTRTVKLVESALGFEVFSRTTRQVSVTPAGKEFVALAERLLGDLKLGVDSMRASVGEQRGQLAVSSVLLLADPRLSAVVAAYRQRWPAIDLHFREGMQSNVLDDVRSGAADFGIAYVNALPETFAVETLGVETLHVVLPSGHNLSRRRRIALSEIRDATWVSYPVDSRTRRVVDSMAAADGYTLRHGVTVNRVSTLMGMVQDGVGVAVVPSSERPRKSDRDITSRPLASAGIARLGLVRLRERELTAQASDLWVAMKGWVRAVAPRRLRSARKSDD